MCLGLDAVHENGLGLPEPTRPRVCSTRLGLRMAGQPKKQPIVLVLVVVLVLEKIGAFTWRVRSQSPWRGAALACTLRARVLVPNRDPAEKYRNRRLPRTSQRNIFT